MDQETTQFPHCHRWGFKEGPSEVPEENNKVFGSVLELAEWLESTPDSGGNGTASRHSDRGHGWDLGLGWEGAMRYAKGEDTWADGVEKLTSGLAIAETRRAPMEAEILGNDVAGFTPDVPAFLAGVPDCMRTMQVQEAERDVVSIGFCGFSAGCTAAAMLNRGVALLSLVDALESTGYRTELWYDDAIEGARMRVCIKADGDHWDPTTAAYAVAHPGFFRRLRFSFVEKFKECDRETREGGYGCCELHGDYTFGLGYQYGDNYYSTLDKALRTVEGIAREQGFDVDLTGTH